MKKLAIIFSTLFFISITAAKAQTTTTDTKQTTTVTTSDSKAPMTCDKKSCCKPTAETTSAPMPDNTGTTAEGRGNGDEKKDEHSTCTMKGGSCCQHMDNKTETAPKTEEQPK